MCILQVVAASEYLKIKQAIISYISLYFKYFSFQYFNKNSIVHILLM
jgi:hypothetical protein